MFSAMPITRLKRIDGEFAKGKPLFVLKGKRPVRCSDYGKWCEWMRNSDGQCSVGLVEYANGVVVSTVFLGVDQTPGSKSGPATFETIVSGGEHDGYSRIYKTWKQAEQGHNDTCWLVRETFN